MEKTYRISVTNAIKLKEKNIDLLCKIYKELKGYLNNCNSKKEEEITKYNLLIVLYTYYEELQKKEQYKSLYYSAMIPNNKKSEIRKVSVIINLNNSIKSNLNHKLKVLDIYLNNSKEFERIIKYGNKDILSKNYNLNYSDINLINFLICNYGKTHKNYNKQKKIK